MLTAMATGVGFVLDMTQVGTDNTATTKDDAPGVLAPVVGYDAFALALSTTTFDGSGFPVATWVGLNLTATPAFDRGETSFYSSADTTIGVRSTEDPKVPIASGTPSMATRLTITQVQT